MKNHNVLPHRLERTLEIEAPRETVFRFFTDNARWAAWWGSGSTVEPRAGGKVLIRYPEGTEASGEVVEVVPPERFVFTYGYVKGTPIAPGSSLVTIQLEHRGNATRVRLTHAFADLSIRDQHVQGWRYQLSLFANVVADEVLTRAGELVDQWFITWSHAESSAVRESLQKIAAPQVRMRDRFSAVQGIDDLVEHIAAARRFMPGLELRRSGDVRQCQGTALADWITRGPDGQERGRGTNVFTFNADARIESVTGFWK